MSSPARAHAAGASAERLPLVATGVAKAYEQARRRLPVLRDVNLRVAPGERVGIVGRSGTGKSTLLHILAGLSDPDHGAVSVMGQPLSNASAAARARLRNRRMGFVYQFHHLLPEFSALENVAMPLLVGGAPFRAAAARAKALLAQVELAERATHRPHQLSGGERQRVAVARALAPAPAIVLADEPTGNLDRQSANRVIALLTALGESTGTALVVVSHDWDMCSHVHRTLALEDGVLRPAPNHAGNPDPNNAPSVPREGE